MAASPRSHDPARRRALRVLGTGAGVTLALGGAGTAQAYRFGFTEHRRPLIGLTRPVRAALLTDLHYGLYIAAGSVRAWVEATNAARPDLVLLGGDQLDARLQDSPGPLLAELSRLRAPLGVYGVWGNHDYGSFRRYANQFLGRAPADREARRMASRRAFADAGVTILRDEGRALRDDLWLGGVDDLWHGQPDPARALAGAGKRGTVLLSHNPDILPDLPLAAGLVLCGHTHGGQVRLPLFGALVVPSDYGQRFAMGWVSGAHGTPGYVSRGLGMSGLPFRNLCPPEIALLTLTPPG